MPGFRAGLLLDGPVELFDLVNDGLALISLQWYFRIVGSPVFIRMHFLPDALHVLKQSAISFPYQLDFASDVPVLDFEIPVDDALLPTEGLLALGNTLSLGDMLDVFVDALPEQ